MGACPLDVEATTSAAWKEVVAVADAVQMFGMHALRPKCNEITRGLRVRAETRHTRNSKCQCVTPNMSDALCADEGTPRKQEARGPVEPARPE
jgi:hypothetical protein